MGYDLPSFLVTDHRVRHQQKSENHDGVHQHEDSEHTADIESGSDIYGYPIAF